MTAANDTPEAEALLRLLPPMFRECFDRNSVKYDMSTPFVVGDFCYATDGHVIMRVPATGEIRMAFAALPVREKRRLSANSIATVWEDADAFVADPTSPPSLSGYPACKQCGGSGRSWCECCDQACNCPNCDNGIPISIGIPVGGGVKIAPRYAHLLIEHGASLFSRRDGARNKAIRFTAPGGVEGRLMPLQL